MRIAFSWIALWGALFGPQASRLMADHVLPSLAVASGAINQVVIRQGDAALAVYHAGEAQVDQLLLTHHRRDVVWSARLVDDDCRVVAPESERELLENPQVFWEAFQTARFHDYAQQSTKIIDRPIRVTRWVREGDRIDWGGPELQVLSTPGYTRGSVSYVATLDGRKVVFTGDLIIGDGQLLDLYSFQDEIPDANVRGYHGYGGRLSALVKSLQKIADLNPDLIVPARGPVIEQPRQAIEKLIQRVQTVYANYLSTSALNWYFKEDRMRTCGRRVLDPDDPIELMPYSVHQPAPDWVFEHATSRLLIADNGHGFLLDCGYQRVIDAVDKLMQMGVVSKIDGIFVTHYHDDHTDMVQAAAEHFQCPVYATEPYVDVLQHPEAYHLPAMTSNPISPIVSMEAGQTMSWQEFELTFHFFPGQTFYHGALLVERADQRPVFFVGDSFAPSGMDDYCVLNRNLIHPDAGYSFCFQTLRSMQTQPWLVNEHIPYVFEFSTQEMDYLESRYRHRAATLAELFPWDDPNYGIDEQWAVFYPYGIKTASGKLVSLQLRVENHSPVARTFRVNPRTGDGLKLKSEASVLTLPSRAIGSVTVDVEVSAEAGVQIVTADIESEGMEFRDWVEAMVTIEP